MNINPSSILYQLDRIDPEALAARLADRERVEAEAAAAEANGKSVQVVYVERRGAASVKKFVAKVEKKLKRKAIIWVRNKFRRPNLFLVPASDGDEGDGRSRSPYEAPCGRD